VSLRCRLSAGRECFVVSGTFCAQALPGVKKTTVAAANHTVKIII
jgi:hypothetical protein